MNMNDTIVVSAATEIKSVAIRDAMSHRNNAKKYTNCVERDIYIREHKIARDMLTIERNESRKSL